MRRFNSLHEFLISTPLTIDAIIDDLAGVPISLKGIEVDAAVLFADLRSFSSMSTNLGPTGSFILASRFIAWMSEDGLANSAGIIDKYIGDEIMVVFSKAFGSDDPVKDAVYAGCRMIKGDLIGYSPRIGIAFGPVLVGYVGTPMHYSPTVIGPTVNMAARCVGFRPSKESNRDADDSGAVVMPKSIWSDSYSEYVNSGYKSLKFEHMDSVDLKGIGPTSLLRIYEPPILTYIFDAETNESRSIVDLTLDEMEKLRKMGTYRPHS